MYSDLVSSATLGLGHMALMGLRYGFCQLIASQMSKYYCQNIQNV